MGRKKLIETPQRLIDLFNEYVKWVEDNPIKIEDYVGKNADRVMRQKPRCLTMVGFENHVYTAGIMTDLCHYFANKDNRYDDYVSICTRIRAMIRQDQIEGGMAGIYNTSITQRLNNLKEQVEQTNKNDGKVEIKYNFPDND